jgi:hypothetical protein
MKHLAEFFESIDIVSGIMDGTDANRERSAKVCRGIESFLACYEELYKERKKAAWYLSFGSVLQKG